MSNPCEPGRAVAPDRADSPRRRPVKAGRIGLPILPARRRGGKEARAKALELRAKLSCSRLRRYPLQSGRRAAAPDAASERQPHLTAGCSRSSMDSCDAAGDFASGVGAAALANDERHGRDEKASSPYSTSRFWRRWAASRNPCAFPATRRRSKRRGVAKSSATGWTGCRRPEVPIVSSRGRSHGSRSWLGRRGQFTPGLRRAVNDFRDPRR